MTRENEIINASVAYNEKIGRLNVIGGDSILSQEEYIVFNKNPHFIAGAKWSDEHPNQEAFRTRLKLEKEEWLNKACKFLEEIFDTYKNMTDYNPMEDFLKAME